MPLPETVESINTQELKPEGAPASFLLFVCKKVTKGK